MGVPGEVGQAKVNRRTAIIGAGCFALAAAVPGSATAHRRHGRCRVPAAAGTGQTPIDLRDRDVTFVKRLPRIELSYPRRADVTLVNTGSPDEFATVRAELPAGAAHLTLGGVRYDLLQFHWHTPSEHEIEGRLAPLEMHLVHQRADGGLLVIGVFMRRGEPNRGLEPIFAELPERPGDRREIAGLRMSGLLPDEDASYRYSGSLTTPPFTEGVQWIVLAQPLSLSRRQIGAFQELFEEGNRREVQPLNGRQILSDADDD